MGGKSANGKPNQKLSRQITLKENKKEFYESKQAQKNRQEEDIFDEEEDESDPDAQKDLCPDSIKVDIDQQLTRDEGDTLSAANTRLKQRWSVIRRKNLNAMRVLEVNLAQFQKRVGQY